MSDESENRSSGIKSRSGAGTDGVIRVFGKSAANTRKEDKPDEQSVTKAVSGRQADKERGDKKRAKKAAPKKSKPSKQNEKADAGAKDEGKKKSAASVKKHSAGIAAVLLIMFTAAACVGIYMITLVSSIKVYGCEKYTAAQIINSAGIYTGRCILTYDTNAIASRIAEDPYIKVNYVKRVYPNEIGISITERSEYAAICTSPGKYCIIDRDGTILNAESGDPLGLLTVNGLGTIGFKTGKNINDDKSLLRPFVLMELFEALGERDGEIAVIDLSVPASLKITTTDGFTVHMGDSVDIAEKTARMFTALDKARAKGGEAKIIYINSSGSSDLSGITPAPTAVPTAVPTATPDPEGSPDDGALGTAGTEP